MTTPVVKARGIDCANKFKLAKTSTVQSMTVSASHARAEITAANSILTNPTRTAIKPDAIAIGIQGNTKTFVNKLTKENSPNCKRMTGKLANVAANVAITDSLITNCLGNHFNLFSMIGDK